MQGTDLYMIDQNVPLPLAKKNRRDRATETADELRYLESFVAPSSDYTPSALRSLVGRLNKTLAPKRFKGASVDGGVRIWRTDIPTSEASDE